jgi:hypothetical protein
LGVGIKDVFANILKIYQIIPGGHRNIDLFVKGIVGIVNDAFVVDGIHGIIFIAKGREIYAGSRKPVEFMFQVNLGKASLNEYNY